MESPTTPEAELESPPTAEEWAQFRGKRWALLDVFPRYGLDWLHQKFDGNANAAADFLGFQQHGPVSRKWSAKGLARRGKEIPRRGRNLEDGDRDYEKTGEEVWAGWGEDGKHLTEYANEYRWAVPKGQEFVDLVLLSDLHAQSRLFDQPRLQSSIDYIAEDPSRRWLCAGDLFTNNTKSSVGSVQQQTVGLSSAIRGLAYGLEPIAKQCVGIAKGNHDARLQNKQDVEFDPVERLTKMLGVPYFGYAKHLVLRIGRQRYTLYVHHGTSGAATAGGRLNAGLKVMGTVTSDITIVGHLHDEMSRKAYRRGPAEEEAQNGKVPVIDHKQHMVMVASFERYGDWAQEKALPPTPLGSSRIEFSARKRDWHVVT